MYNFSVDAGWTDRVVDSKLDIGPNTLIDDKE